MNSSMKTKSARAAQQTVAYANAARREERERRYYHDCMHSQLEF